MDLKDWISEKDLDIKEFTEQFIEVVKDEYGKHNFKQVLDTVNNEFSNSVTCNSIDYKDLDRCFDTLLTYIEKKEPWFDRKQYIFYATMIAETIEIEKKLNIISNDNR